MNAVDSTSRQSKLLIWFNKKTSQGEINNPYIEAIFYRYLPGRIIFLLGTYASGKTTIANHIKTKSQFADNIIIMGSDYIWAKMIILVLKKRFSKQINFLLKYIKDYETLLLYINQPYLFIACHNNKNSIHTKTQKILQKIYQHKDQLLADISWENYQHCLSSTMVLELQHGKTLLIDTSSQQDFAITYNLIKCQINTVMIYCSPAQLMEHIIEYNHNNINNLTPKIRTFFPFDDYLELYSKTICHVEAIDLIRVDDIEKLDLSFLLIRSQTEIADLLEKNQGIGIVQQDIWRNLLSRIDFKLDNGTQKNDAAIKQKFIIKLFDSKQTTTYITPKQHYQFLLNTGLNNQNIDHQRLTDLIDQTECKDCSITKIKPQQKA
jgi:energy-coupling factor transporter ATP-binding protein EcfA2